MKTTTIQPEQELKIFYNEYNQPVNSGDSQDQQNCGIIDVVPGPYIGAAGTNSIKILKDTDTNPLQNRTLQNRKLMTDFIGTLGEGIHFHPCYPAP